MRALIGIAVGLLLLLAADSFFLGGKFFITLTIFIDNVKVMTGW